jgi:hypothetical protein
MQLLDKGASDQIADLKTLLREAVGVLEEVEWADNNDFLECPYCGGIALVCDGKGHTLDCALDAMIEKYRGCCDG